MSLNTSVRIPDDLAVWLEDRATRMATGHGPARQMVTEANISRGLLAMELGSIWQPFQLGEMALLAEVMGDAPLDRAAGMIVWNKLLDILQPRGYRMPSQRAVAAGERHGLTPEQTGDLLDRLRELTVGEDAALRDALSRWMSTGHAAGAESFAAVGIPVLSGNAPS